MAKLNGVKTLDMVNGEITKVAYDGAEYVKVEEPKVGDIVKVEYAHRDFTWGAFYEVVRIYEKHKYTRVTDDVGDGHDVQLRFIKVFRKVSATSKAKTYEPKVGDIVVITGDATLAQPVNKVGDIGKITEVDKTDRTARVYVAGKRNEGNWSSFSEVRPATADEIAQYEKAIADANKPKVKAGDFVKITEEATYFTPDKLYKVFEVNGVPHITDDEGDDLYAVLAVGSYVLASADEAKWAKLEREVNEYKVGDIISYEYRNPIAYYIVTRIDGDKVYFNSHEFGNAEEFMPKDSPKIKLVAPVESTM